MSQTTFNKKVQGQICELAEHAKVANEEMAFVKADLAVVRNDVGWLKDSVKSIDGRTWWILGTVVLGILIAIFLK